MVTESQCSPKWVGIIFQTAKDLWFQRIVTLFEFHALRHRSHGPVEIVDLPSKNGGSFHGFWYVYLQPAGSWTRLVWDSVGAHGNGGQKNQRGPHSIEMIYCLVVTGTMEIWMTFPNILGISYSQLVRTPSFFRGVGIPPTSIYIYIQLNLWCTIYCI